MLASKCRNEIGSVTRLINSRSEQVKGAARWWRDCLINRLLLSELSWFSLELVLHVAHELFKKGT